MSSAFLNSTERLQNEVPKEKVSLTLMDFGYKDNNNENLYINFDKSIIAQKIDYSSSSGDNQLTYAILKSNYPSIIKFHEDRLLNRFNSQGNDLKRVKTNLHRNVVVYSDSEKRSFVLVAEDRVVDIKKDLINISDEEFLNKIYRIFFYKWIFLVNKLLIKNLGISPLFDFCY